MIFGKSEFKFLAYDKETIHPWHCKLNADKKKKENIFH